MVVTRQSNHRDSGETAEENTLGTIPEGLRIPTQPQPQMPFVFHPPNPMTTGEEFDIAEDTDSVRCESETKDTVSEVTTTARRSEDPSPSRGGTEVVRLLASLHDLSRQMEVTMVDLRAQLGSRLGNESAAWDSGDYTGFGSSLPHDSVARQRLARMKGMVKKTWSGVVSRLLLAWQLLCLRYPAVTVRLAEMVRRVRPLLVPLGYLVLANVMYGAYQTHRRLVERHRQRAASWL
ncbi:uncharacterized protein LOC119095975 [Pollicipes pollicipes]|uniref:uncharacterized protein LOC119095975 n=1 Tax=Pollicipes pollicipes TaxID=41117 RepID=UPI00188537BF|nr:uncharacterized protein LOC119095975 [Pollicipes pollicipes]